jgi:quinol-cytochrome oxidoreductase complex cytochrome b subunit
MVENRKDIEQFLDERLRRSASRNTTSEGFTEHVMKQAKTEYDFAVAENKRDRIAKYIIGSFSFITIAFTLLLGYLSRSEVNETVQSTNIKIQPTIQSSNTFIQQFIMFIQNVFTGALGLLGLTVSTRTVTILLVLLIVFTLYFLADRFFLKGKLRSTQG